MEVTDATNEIPQFTRGLMMVNWPYGVLMDENKVKSFYARRWNSPEITSDGSTYVKTGRILCIDNEYRIEYKKQKP
jgi:hypothetical protein